MKHKRFFYAMTAVIYSIVLLFCVLYAFTVKSVKCSYTMVQGDTGYERADKILSKAVGKNLLFLNTADIKRNLEKDPYIQVKYIKKDYPDVIKLSIEERKEMFFIADGDEAYVLDEHFFVLARKPVFEVGDLIELELVNIKDYLGGLKEGTYFGLIDDEIIKCVDKMLNVFSDWKNLLKNVIIEKKDYLDQNHGNFRVNFQTVQGCTIVIMDCLIHCEEKAQRAYETYLGLTDLERSEGKLEAYELELDSYVYPDSIKVNYSK